MAKEKNIKSKSPADKLINIIIAVVVVAVLALAVFAIANKFKPEVYTVADAAVEQGMDVDEFVTTFGLGDAKADDKMEDYIGSMTCENYAKLIGLSYEEFVAEYQIPEAVTPDMTIDEINHIMEELMALSQEVADEGQSQEQAPTATETAE